MKHREEELEIELWQCGRDQISSRFKPEISAEHKFLLLQTNMKTDVCRQTSLSTVKQKNQSEVTVSEPFFSVGRAA